MEAKAFFLGLLSFLAFKSGCLPLGPYDRGDFRNSPKLRHSGIPLKPGTRFVVRQGAFGRSSHNEPGNEFSWDLEVPWGTPVYAVEAGRVLYRYQPPGGGGCDSIYAHDAWNIQIENEDGTVAQYTHVDSTLSPGNVVTKGQIIGKNVPRGWVCYPHVHYSVYRSKNSLYSSKNRENLPLYFDGIPGGLLMEWHSYTAP